MIQDFRELPDGSEIDCDVCIVGAGAAGITIARSLADRGFSVVLVEGGGEYADLDSQELYEGESVGLDYVPLTATRLRFLGGSTNHWTGTCVIYDPIDFAERPWIADSGWPVDYADYAAYLPAASRLLELTEPDDPEAYWETFGVDLPAIDRDKLFLTTSQRTQPVRFGERFRPELEASPNLRLLLNANLFEIVAEPTARHVESVTLKSFAGTTGTVRARHFVLACGGIENPRLLLASRSVEPHGLGNRHDVVGRYFADHPAMPIGEVLIEDQGALLDPLGDRFVTVDGVDARWYPLLKLSPALQERFELPNSLVYIYKEPATGSGLESAIAFAKAVRQGDWPDDAGQLVGRSLGELDDIAAAAWRRFVLGRQTIRTYAYLGMVIQIDPVPNRDSRITLGAELDPLGMPRLELDLRISEQESRGIKIMGEVIGAELARLGLGRLRLYDWLEKIGDGLWSDAYAGSETAERFRTFELWGHHHHGTTRMASDPRKGVVDGNCKVHGIDNLFVAGSSTFPVPGSGNPTISIVAFALRLADHLQTRLA
jgi:choline dehydrogenase-like flavoprotein